MMDNFTASFYQNFIEDDRWKYITDGLFNTECNDRYQGLVDLYGTKYDEVNNQQLDQNWCSTDHSQIDLAKGI